MKTLVPDYYDSFRCTASDCRHNCCRAGWEIGLDDVTAGIYRKRRDSLSDSLSRKFAESVFFPSVKQRREGARPVIRLENDGSCPFLNRNGLCDLIIDGGEINICQVCRDHPRFRNFYPDRIEMGIGMCCEEALRLILGTEDAKYRFLKTGESAEPAHIRLHGRERVREAMTAVRNPGELIPEIGRLEQLDPQWGKILARYQEAASAVRKEEPGKEMKCLEEYLLYRHFRESGPGFIAFALLLIRELYMHTEYGFEEICRLFSTEIEYSDENMTAVRKIIS